MEIWHLDLHLDRDAFRRAYALLDPQERARCARLRGSLLRHRYAAAHAGLRRLLARRLRCPPAQVLLARDPGGKPRLRPGPGRPVHFSLAHAGDHALVAMSAEHAVGVDLELLPPPGGISDDLADHLSATERQALDVMPPGLQALAALRCWVRKEALLKASGHGLALAPSGLSMSWGDAAFLLDSQLPAYAVGRWVLSAHERAGEWTAAVAWPAAAPARPEVVRWLRWPDDVALIEGETGR
jgi:4'-phosphopantetheinyl transferase